jgi:hypothetical protein|tara:strand:+ start:134 stop:478 length:345 start_codon:yes stop_codon:yes gene_type:complete
MKTLLISFILLTCYPAYSFAGWFGSDTYEECLLDEDVGGARTKEGVREIKKACSKRHPEYKQEINLRRLKSNAHKSYSNYSDCELVNVVKKNGNGEYSDKFLKERYGINPSKCD